MRKGNGAGVRKILIISILAVLISGAFIGVAAADAGGIDGGIKWTYDSSNKILTIEPASESEITETGYTPGQMKDYTSSSTAPWRLEGGRLAVSTLTIKSGVNNIGKYAFYYMTGITASLTIPDTVTDIGEYAFSNCNYITGNLTIPNTITSINPHSFENCLFTGLTIPDSVTTIGVGAFQGNSEITSVTIPDTVTTMESAVFNNCAKLSSVTLSKNLTNLPDYTFSYCTNLTSVTIPDTVTVIGMEAFIKCTGLTSMTIPDSVTTIGVKAFKQCTGLTSMAIPESVTTIGSEAFMGCSNLKTITIAGNPGFYSNAFADLATGSVIYSKNNVYYYTSSKTAIGKLSNDLSSCTFTIGGSLTLTTDNIPEIKGYTFEGWYSNSERTSSVSLPHTVNENVLYLKMTGKTATVTLNANGGTAGTPSSVSMTYGSVLPALSGFQAPTKTNYTFTGYWTKANGGTQYYNPDGTAVENQKCTIDLEATTPTLYAQWTADVYSITYSGLEGATVSPANPTSYTVETDTFTLTNPTKTGYDFAGWTGTDLSGATTTVTIAKGSTGDRSYTATWTAKTTTVTLDDGSATTSVSPSEITMTYDSTDVGITTDPVKTGYTLQGWYTAASGGTKVMDANHALIAGVDGWTDADGKWIKTDETANLYAQWTIDTYSITYSGLEGATVSPANPKSYTVETETFTLTNPTKTGYDFAGWTGTDLSEATTTVTIAKGSTGDRSYTATWTAKTTSVTLDDGSATTSVSPSEITMTYDSTDVGIETDPVKTGYTLQGWYTAASGGTKVLNADHSTVKNVSGWTKSDGKWANTDETATLYAQWKAKTTKVTLNDGGATTSVSPSSITMTYDSSSVGISRNPVKTGYTLQGWFTEASDGTKIMDANHALIAGVDGWTNADGKWIKTDATTTLYAQWTAKTTSVTLNDGGATTSVSPSEITMTYDSSDVGIETDPVNTGYNLVGWFTAASGGVKVLNADHSTVNGVSGWTKADGKWANTDETATLYARWSNKTTTVTLDGNGATTPASPTSITMTYGTSTVDTFTDPLNPGYYINGWYSDASDGTLIMNPDHSLVAGIDGWTDADGKWIKTDTETTVYAHWTAKPLYPVTVNSGEHGTGAAASVAKAYEGLEVTLTPPKADTWCKFNGWSSTPTVTITSNKFTMPGEAVTITAQYSVTGESYVSDAVADVFTGDNRLIFKLADGSEDISGQNIVDFYLKLTKVSERNEEESIALTPSTASGTVLGADSFMIQITDDSVADTLKGWTKFRIGDSTKTANSRGNVVNTNKGVITIKTTGGNVEGNVSNTTMNLLLKHNGGQFIDLQKVKVQMTNSAGETYVYKSPVNDPAVGRYLDAGETLNLGYGISWFPKSVEWNAERGDSVRVIVIYNNDTTLLDQVLDVL